MTLFIVYLIGALITGSICLWRDSERLSDSVTLEDAFIGAMCFVLWFVIIVPLIGDCWNNYKDIEIWNRKSPKRK